MEFFGTSNSEPVTIARGARRVCPQLALAAREQKDAALLAMAKKLAERTGQIVDANQKDLDAAASAGLPANMLQRLRFGEQKLVARQRSLQKIAELPDPVGEIIRSARRPNGLEVARVRVPLGVILMVYEARPHVTVNAGAFSLKAGNAVILRGGSEARHCNSLLGALWQESLSEVGLPANAIQTVVGSHEQIRELLKLDEYIDLVVPRGGKELIRAVAEHSRIPVIKHYEGVCHVYLDEACNLEAALNIALDSKCLMPEVCNAMETLLVSRSLRHELPSIVETFRRCGVAVRGCEETRAVVPCVDPASEADWRTEYLDMIVSIRLVADVDEAVEHINQHGSHHTDGIVTDSEARARKFVERVDSAVVLVNASTMFCDGESLGMGAEIGISTDKLHARGPMGLEELTSYKFVIRGDVHVMGRWSQPAGERSLGGPRVD
jgi:glutamate-5-semialdehyde dehydrogenase